jgi:polyferredoxin
MGSWIQQKDGGVKAFFIVVSLGFGLFVGIKAERAFESTEIALGAGLGAALLYPLLSAFIIEFCEDLRKWAYQEQASPWHDGKRILLGAIWPITLVASAIIFIFLGLINRLYRR